MMPTLATFSDFRIVKTRKLAQLIFEVPIEQADAALAALGGLPRSDGERWCGIALLNSAASPSADTGPHPSSVTMVPAPEAEAKSADKPRRRFSEMSRAQQAGMLCHDMLFQDWAIERWPDVATPSFTSTADIVSFLVKRECGVASRSDLDKTASARVAWDGLVSQYRQETGMETEQR